MIDVEDETEIADATAAKEEINKNIPNQVKRIQVPKENLLTTTTKSKKHSHGISGAEIT